MGLASFSYFLIQHGLKGQKEFCDIFIQIDSCSCCLYFYGNVEFFYFFQIHWPHYFLHQKRSQPSHRKESMQKKSSLCLILLLLLMSLQLHPTHHSCCFLGTSKSSSVLTLQKRVESKDMFLYLRYKQTLELEFYCWNV